MSGYNIHRIFAGGNQMTKLKQSVEFGARLITWLGVWVIEIVYVWELMKNNICSLFGISCLFIFIIATFITGYLDMNRYIERAKKN
jgi:hypothetical protein